MLRRLLFSAPVLLAILLPLKARATDGFIIGLEGGYATWSIDGSKMRSTNAMLELDPGAGSAFAQPINDKSNYALNLHLGWNFFGHASVEAAIHATSWDLFNPNRGGAGFVGGRVTWFPMQLFLSKARKYDVGIELGSGYSIAGGPTYGMDGPYFQFGITGEYRVSKFVGFALNIRHFMPFWNKFYVDWNNNISTGASGVSAGWTTFTLGVNLHVSPSDS